MEEHQTPKRQDDEPETNDAGHQDASSSLAATARRRRSCKPAMILRRSASSRRTQLAISSALRPHPRQRPVAGSRMQVRVHGVEMAITKPEQHDSILLWPHHDQEADQGCHLTKLLHRSGDVTGMAADEP